MSTASNIIDGLRGQKVSSYGFVHESDISEIKESEVNSVVDEDEWKTMHGAHILVDDKGGIKAGGPEEMREKVSKKEIEAGVKDANEKSKESNKSSLNDKEESEVRKSFSGSGQEKKQAIFSVMKNNNEDVFSSVKSENPEMYKELSQGKTQTLIDDLARKISNGESKFKDSMSDDKKKKLQNAVDSHIKNLDKIKSSVDTAINSKNEDDYVKSVSDLKSLHKDIAKGQLEIAKLLW